MIADAKKDGVNIGITDSYRPYAEQVDVARRKGLYSQGGLAAKPGTSEHGWGMATDLDLNAKALAWMRENGEKYGFVENVPREPWHWAYKPKSWPRPGPSGPADQLAVQEATASRPGRRPRPASRPRSAAGRRWVAAPVAQCRAGPCRT